MKTIKRSFLTNFFKIVLLLTLASCAGVSDDNRRPDFEKRIGSGRPFFFHESVKYFGETNDEFVYVTRYKIEYDRLHFEKVDGGFKAKYEASLAIFPEGEEIPIKQKMITREVFVDNFKDTGERNKFDFYEFQEVLPPGVYEAILSINGRGEMGFSRKEDLRFNYSGNYGASNLSLIKSTDGSFKDESLIPLVDNHLSDKDNNFGIYFEIFSKGSKPYNINYTIFDSYNMPILNKSLDGVTSERITKELLAVNLSNNKIGDYYINLDLSIDSLKFRREVGFSIRWANDTAEISSLDEAIKQLVYLLDADSLNKVLTFTEESKKEWFDNFWIKLDGNIQDKAYMDEYYRRVNYSNINFGTEKKNGWKTDMGQVYIVMGEPDEIQRYEFEKYTRPYVVWIYYAKSSQYIFDYIAGEYKLRTF
ncbi:MAG: GWxTD domain-containing protein [Candidatus Delongbacteria bacterium]|nr:GWxTD domain-containing protein [Candidatus Delongbacteria bacterium]MBN2835749.1 GWxTD domain-containing protein [Candidatus Delongbacteria bacterium]